MALSGEKRPSEERERELGFPLKRSKDLKKAAEIVMVLSAMGEMRGGVGPTEEERRMMAEARERLARACEGFAPKELFPREAFESVMEDIGLKRTEGKKLGLRNSKMSIGEKFLITKHKRFQTNSGTVIPTSDKPCPAKFPSFELRAPCKSSGLPTGPLGKDSSMKAVPKVDIPQIRPETRLNGSTYALPTKVKPAGDQPFQKSPAFTQQVQSSLSAKGRSDNKVILNPPTKVQAPPVETISRVRKNITQGSLLNDPHIEICKIVQKFLQPQIPKHPIWIPPSRDYMNKPMPCQVCNVNFNDVANAFVCDACEKGYHIKCVDSHNQKGVPKGEWHCSKCLSLTNGKPLPPKYGRVTRNMSAPKVNTNTAVMKVGKVGEKENQPKIIANGKAALQISARNMGNNGTELIGKKTRVYDNLSKSHSNSVTIKDSEVNANGGDIRKEDQEIVRDERTDISGDGITVGEGLSLPLHVSNNVDWIGDVFQVVDEKIYYQSCCVDGVVYKVNDHALLCSESSTDQFTPSKLQAMWEDRKNKSKWVLANRCYFHNDLPKEVGRPFPPESNEVCESTHGITIMAGLIRGPCEVLPLGKHIEESQRRLRLSSKENDGLQPIFLCKWFFDETKGSFRDMSS